MADTLPIATFANFQPQVQSSFVSADLIGWLPPAAADKLRMIRQRFEDARSLTVSFETRHTASTDKLLCAARLKRLVDRADVGGFNLPDDDPHVIAERKTLAALTAECKRLDEIDAVRSAQWREAGSVLANVEAYLRDGRSGNTTLEAVEIEPPKLNKGEGIVDGIERLRRRVRELRADLHRIQSSCYPSSHAKAQMRAQVEALAQRGPSVSRLVELDQDIDWPTCELRSNVYNAPGGAIAFAEAPDTLALFAWLHRDALIKRLDAEIDAEADDKSALSHAEREKAEAQVQADLLAVERDECALVWRAQSENLPVEH
jgi:hypothetical protein